MRGKLLISTVLVVSLAAPVFAEDWIDYASSEDHFGCNFPGQPKVMATTYKSEYGADLPARVYSAVDRQSRYTMTVVDYNDIGKMLAENVKKCTDDPATCKRNVNNVPMRAEQEIAGAITYATGKLIERDVRVTMLISGWMDRVEGHHLQFTDNTNKSRTYASIYMHENRLYIMEGTVPPGYPEPALFQQSLQFLDENGNAIRYQSIYRNGYPAPPRAGRGGQAR